MPLQSTRGAGSAKGFGFTVASKPLTVEYLITAGGGGAGGRQGGAGGGGGVITNYPAPAGIILEAGTYPVTVGGGGSGDNGSANGVSGTSSSIAFGGPVGTITAAGGGGGGGISPGVGLDGGSGGGGYHDSNMPDITNAGGRGNTPPVSPPQGQPGFGGLKNNPGTNASKSGGGGGSNAGGPGQNENGGDGKSSTITGSPANYGGGGGGGGRGAGAGTGGSGGGGPGANSEVTGTAGTANTGGGGGAGGFGGDGAPGASGGSGIVYLRAPASSGPKISVTPGTNTKTTAPDGATLLTFTVNGSLTVT
jgi:hypothetical protein